MKIMNLREVINYFINNSVNSFVASTESFFLMIIIDPIYLKIKKNEFIINYSI